jgi:hypothetical protein
MVKNTKNKQLQTTRESVYLSLNFLSFSGLDASFAIEQSHLGAEFSTKLAHACCRKIITGGARDRRAIYGERRVIKTQLSFTA